MKNYRKNILLVLMLLSVVFTNAQEESKREKMDALKVAFITAKLDLSSTEAKAFWPVYNEFHKKRKLISKGLGRPDGPTPHGDHKGPKKPNFDELTDTQISNFIDKRLEQEQTLLNLKVEYLTKYRAVLPIRKVGKLLHAEKDFRKEVLKKIKENHR